MYSQTTQFDLMMKTIMVALFVFGLFVFFVDVTKAAEFWVADPSLCPVTSPSYPAQSCSGLGNICGDRSGIAQCYDTGSFSAPSITATSVFNYSSSFSGGYLVNCFATSDGDVHPYAQCDNELEINGGRKFWCDRNESCFATPTNKMTICNADAWASSTCGNCLSGYADCDGNGTTCEIRFGYTPSTTVPNTVYDSCTTVTCASGYLDCNGNPVDGCEVQNGGSCSIGGLDGVWQGCACVPPISNFQTGIEAMYSTTSPLLWGKQFGSGDLVSFSNATSSNIFVVKNDASVFMSSTLATTTDKYFYNYNGDLYWGDEKLNTGGGVYTAGDGLNLAGYEFTVDTSSNFIWSGQHTFNATTTFPLGVWNADGKVGIGTTTPQFKLSLVVDAYDGMTIYNTSSQMLAGIGSNPTGLSGGMGLFNAGTMIPAISFDAGASSFINNNYNFGIGTSTPSSKLTLVGNFDIAENGLLKFNGISGSIDQIIKINALGFPEWVDVNSLFVNNTTFNSSTEFNSTSTFNSTAIFEGPSYFNNDVFVSGTISSTNLFVNGNSTTTGDLYVLGQAIFHDILPADNLAYTIGTSSFVWKEGWFGKIIAENILFGENGLKIVTTTDGGIAFASSSDDIFLKIFSTGQVAVGTTTITSSLKMKVAGDFGATRYCDENGENCFDPAGLWTDLPAREIMTTTDKYSGNIITTTPQGSLSGYRAANAICNAEFSGSHFCFTGEIINIIAKRDSYVSSTFGSIINNGWIAEGPPGYIAPANDCRGFTTSSNSILGAWWNYDKNGGMGWRVNCSELFPISCCK